MLRTISSGVEVGEEGGDAKTRDWEPATRGSELQHGEEVEREREVHHLGK